MTGATGGRAAVGPARWRLPHPTLVWLIAAAWAVAVAAQATGRGSLLHHDTLAGAAVAPWAALGLFLVAWQLMIAAMMLPSSLPSSPCSAGSATTSPGRGRPGRRSWAAMWRSGRPLGRSPSVPTW